MPDRLDGALGPKVDRLVQEADVDWDSRFIRTRSFLLSEREREKGVQSYSELKRTESDTLSCTHARREVYNARHTHTEKRKKRREMSIMLIKRISFQFWSRHR
jgi:hypothetical protein